MQQIEHKTEKIGTVRALYRCPAKKAPMQETDSLTLIAGVGIEGDCHADGSDRQIALMTVSEKEWMAKQDPKGFCFRKYKENLLLELADASGSRGIPDNRYAPGDLLLIGSTVLEISGGIKNCHPELCTLAVSSSDCLLAESSRFAVVRESGVIRVGMEILLYKQRFF